MPASTAGSLPPATAPRNPRQDCRTGLSYRCAQAATAKPIHSTQILRSITVPSFYALRYNSDRPVRESQPTPPRADAENPPPEEPMLYCPVCSTRLTARKCKLLCEKCGYYMSCADYY